MGSHGNARCDYSNTNVSHRKALLNAIDVVNAEAGHVRDLTVIVSTRTILQAVAKMPKISFSFSLLLLSIPAH